MQKLLRLAIFAVVVSLTSNAYPILNNLFFSGELRTRAYYQENVDGTTGATPACDECEDEFGRIEQRVRLTSNAELTDGVFVVMTGEITGLWGTQEEGLSSGSTEGDADIPEGYVHFQDIKTSDWSVKIGRQHMNFGRGFLISDNEKELSYDALLIAGEFPTWTLSLAAAKLQEAQTLSDIREARIEFEDVDWSLYLLDFEWRDENILPVGLGAYVIYVNDEGASDREPLVFGARADYTGRIWGLWGEVAYEAGNMADQDLRAIAVDVGGSVTFDTSWSPKLEAAYTFASGDSDPLSGDNGNFNPLGQYRYYGHALSPKMSNIHIFNASASVQPNDYWNLAIDYYHYMQDEKVAGPVGNTLLTDPGIMRRTTGLDDHIGDEVDISVTYKYTDDVKAQLLLAYFMPGDAYGADDDDALEIRGEILVSF